MSSSSSTEAAPFTARDGRRFAFPVGTAFFVLMGILVWRDKETAAWVVGGLGAALWLGGTVAPAHLGPIYRGWMKMALAISKVTTPIFLGIVYYLILTPTGLVMRVLGKRPIVHPLQDRSYWRRGRASTRSDLSRQF